MDNKNVKKKRKENNHINIENLILAVACSSSGILTHRRVATLNRLIAGLGVWGVV